MNNFLKKWQPEETEEHTLGHLIADHDLMFTLLDLGNPIFPKYKLIFIDNPDKVISVLSNITELRKSWQNVNSQLSKHFEAIHIEDWFQGHTSVSQEDYRKEPHRNKFNIILA